jgi:hypothetical protein
MSVSIDLTNLPVICFDKQISILHSYSNIYINSKKNLVPLMAGLFILIKHIHIKTYISCCCKIVQMLIRIIKSFIFKLELVNTRFTSIYMLQEKFFWLQWIFRQIITYQYTFYVCMIYYYWYIMLLPWIWKKTF